MESPEVRYQRRRRHGLHGNILQVQQEPELSTESVETPPAEVLDSNKQCELRKHEIAEQIQVNSVPTIGRRKSYFTRRSSFFPEKTDNDPLSLQLFSFFRELRAVCQLKPAVECQCACFKNAEPSGMEDDIQPGGQEWHQRLQSEEGGLQDLQFQLYLKEIQRINPTLREGNLFVDGLYQFVSSRILDSPEATSNKCSVRDLFSVHRSGSMLLQDYWNRPDDPAEDPTYIAVASSFVEFILSTYGPQGVSTFLRRLDCSCSDPRSTKFTFKGKDILGLEFKWRKFADAQVNKRFRLSTGGMLGVLFRKHLASYWISLLLILVFIFCDAALRVTFAYASGQVISLGRSLSRNETEMELDILQFVPLLQWVGVMLLSFFILRSTVVLLSNTVQSYVAVKVSTKLRLQLSNRLHQVTPNFFSNHSSASIISTFLEDINTIEGLVAYGLRSLAFGILMLIASIVYTSVLFWPLGLSLAAVFVLSQVLVQLVTIKVSDHAFAKSQATNKLSTILKEVIDGYSVNRLYDLTDFWMSQMDFVLKRWYSPKAKRSLFLIQFIRSFQVIIPRLIAMLLTFSFILLVRLDMLTFQRGMSILILYIHTVIALGPAYAALPLLQSGTIALGRINAMLYNEEDTAKRGYIQKHGGSMLKNSPGPGVQTKDPQLQKSLPVEFESVCFSYSPMASHWNLFDISLKVSAGERVALVGTSGSGKSTLLNLVLQTYRPKHGEVIVGGESGLDSGSSTDIKVAAVFQFNHIFNMSIRDNIRIGNLQASDEDIEEAAMLSDLHTWVSSLPRGYDTTVRSGGASLSGGQKQRIALARMLVSKAPVFLLDEFTSALDPATEGRVFSQVMEVTCGKTVIAVTHRLEQAKEFDRIGVLSHGKLKEVGTHAELMSLKGAYWHMWNNRSDASSPEGAIRIRRRSLHSTPDLSILPITPGYLTNPRQDEAPPTVRGTFAPLDTLQEIQESLISTASTNKASKVMHITIDVQSGDSGSLKSNNTEPEGARVTVINIEDLSLITHASTAPSDSLSSKADQEETSCIKNSIGGNSVDDIIAAKSVTYNEMECSVDDSGRVQRQWFEQS